MSGSIPCPGCGQPVPPGRLACPSCGALVASVSRAGAADAPDAAGGATGQSALLEGAREASLEQRQDPQPETAETRADAAETATDPAETVARTAEAVADPLAGPAPSADAADTEAGPDHAVEAESENAIPRIAPSVAGRAAEIQARVPPPAEESSPVPAAAELSFVLAREPGHEPAELAPEGELAPEPRPAPIDADVASGVASDGIAPGGLVPGAYVPPLAVHRPAPGAGGGLQGPEANAATVQPGQPAWPAARPPAWASPGPPSFPSAPTPPLVAPMAAGAGGLLAGGGASTPPAADATSTTPGRASMLADLPFDAPDQIEGWLVALGASLGVIGFVLPWRDSLGTGLDGYLGSWGLGIPAHLPFFLLIVVIAALAILPNRVASWVRTGVLGMVGGGLLFGLVWLYLEGGASQLGALLDAVGAVLLVAGGTIAVAPGRSSQGHDQT
jgi:hypothetical protein